MVDAQEWLESQEEYNTPEKRSQITKLYISHKNLAGSLDLSDFINLEKLYCDNNQLTNLNLSNCSQLTEIWCHINQLTQLILPKSLNNLQQLSCFNNLLTELDWTVFNPERLTYLNLQNNNFSSQDLSVLADFTQLESLYLGYNRWTGSLESLKNLSKLVRLDISNTDINQGLEYLPASLKHFYCSTEQRLEAKCQTIFNYFANDQGKMEIEQNRQIIDFPQKLQTYKQKIKKEIERLKVKDFGFSETEIDKLIKDGLKPSEYNFANYLKCKGYIPQPSLTELREEYEKSEFDAQFWLDWKYPQEKREKINELHIKNERIKNILNLQDFPNLEVLDCSHNNLNSLDISNCPKLKKIDISNTEIDFGLEYLPEGLEEFFCEGTKVEKELKKQKWLWEINIDNTILLQRWKKTNLPKFQQQQKLQGQLKTLEEEKSRLEELNQKLTERIPFLEKQTGESTFLIQEQKQKIVKNYLLFTEKEEQTLQKLIEAHKTYFQAKKQANLNIIELRKKYDTLYYKLENEKFIRAVENILTNFEELYKREWDLQNQLKEKEQNSNTLLLIEKKLELIKEDIKKKEINQITYIIDSIKVNQGHALIGNTFGEQANLDYNNYAMRIEEVSEEEFQAQIIHNPPKTNP